MRHVSGADAIMIGLLERQMVRKTNGLKIIRSTAGVPIRLTPERFGHIAARHLKWQINKIVFWKR